MLLGGSLCGECGAGLLMASLVQPQWHVCVHAVPCFHVAVGTGGKCEGDGIGGGRHAQEYVNCAWTCVFVAVLGHMLLPLLEAWL